MSIFTNAYDSSIFTVETVMVSDSRVLTVGKPPLCSITFEFIKVNGRQSTAKEGIGECNRVLDVGGVIELPANNLSFSKTPAIVTDGAPQVVEADLHTTFIGCHSIHQTDISILTICFRHCSRCIMQCVSVSKRC